MRILLLFLILLISVTSSMTFADEITLKNNFFTGWHYSVDGINYDKVGNTGTRLYFYMEGNDSAQQHMLIYKSRKTMELVFAIPGGFLMGWPLGAAISGDEWNDAYTVMIVAGVPLAIASTMFNISATNHLKQAVKIYNSDTQAIILDAGLRISPLINRRDFRLSLVYHF